MQGEWKRKIEGIGGVLHAKVKKGICCTDQFMKIPKEKKKDFCNPFFFCLNERKGFEEIYCSSSCV